MKEDERKINRASMKMSLSGWVDDGATWVGSRIFCVWIRVIYFRALDSQSKVFLFFARLAFFVSFQWSDYLLSSLGCRVMLHLKVTFSRSIGTSYRQCQSALPTMINEERLRNDRKKKEWESKSVFEGETEFIISSSRKFSRLKFSVEHCEK